ncbi:hypothetical protein RA267_27630, partial [Pseudomonas syringae pv. tagetis]|uniref:hypothetical protein n=1 Tax=Pseudomonas syringae group genomosp. 7 TaxID=251699 RepID=UPI003770657B
MCSLWWGVGCGGLLFWGVGGDVRLGGFLVVVSFTCCLLFVVLVSVWGGWFVALGCGFGLLVCGLGFLSGAVGVGCSGVVLWVVGAWGLCV